MRNPLYENYKKRIETELNTRLEPILKGQPYELGSVYYIGYWHQTCIITNVFECVTGQAVEALWQDGTVTRHGTPLDHKFDFKIIKEGR